MGWREIEVEDDDGERFKVTKFWVSDDGAESEPPPGFDGGRTLPDDHPYKSPPSVSDAPTLEA